MERMIDRDLKTVILTDEEKMEMARISANGRLFSDYLNRINAFETDEEASDFLEVLCNKIYEYKMYEHRYVSSLKKKYNFTKNFMFCPLESSIKCLDPADQIVQENS